jgi:16S rRNA G527 N7-methylase RsmG
MADGHRPVDGDRDLIAVLGTIRERGSIGEHSLVDAIAHADRFVARIPGSLPHGHGSAARQLVDLGSGGGLPGLVIAVRRPDLRIVLIERRATRADQLRRAVSSLGVSGHVEVLASDVELVHRARGRFADIATARSFAAAEITARWGSRLLVDGGCLLVSEPPQTDDTRWPADVLEREHLVDEGLVDGVRAFRRC